MQMSGPCIVNYKQQLFKFKCLTMKAKNGRLRKIREYITVAHVKKNMIWQDANPETEAEMSNNSFCICLYIKKK